ncbi:helix-turn-helix transcriptional regulator [Micromonospora sp. WMMD710]|uniref:helix-turn-helix transcriptional regulator n=1 Tax=Micromonospora sp. WMMD710 TaxID=3016085 RepID=UPI0024172A51|nr:helix-turn-helix transcriptional regulator [Micromonospora sp. WMMD710]MDG4758195.1 helix-turn-helix transcriptional regulator [Micromonospora sp. WMMD710]
MSTHLGQAPRGALDDRLLHLYHLLVQRPGATVDELAEALTRTGSETAELLRRLHLDRLAIPLTESDTPARWEAQQPPDTLDAALAREQERIADLRAHARAMQQLTEIYWRQRSDAWYDGVEVISDQVVVMETLAALQLGARRQIRVFDRPPYYSERRPNRIATQSGIQTDRMMDGITYRAIYEHETWTRPEHARVALAAIARGEQARSLASLPMKLFLIDDDRAVMPLDPAHHSDTATLVVHPSGLLRALVDVFEFYWAHATPVSPTGHLLTGPEVTDRERTILSLLSAGANDDLIARRLNLSRSTVTRIVGNLERRVGALSRFQLGAHAVREGWI